MVKGSTIIFRWLMKQFPEKKDVFTNAWGRKVVANISFLSANDVENLYEHYIDKVKEIRKHSPKNAPKVVSFPRFVGYLKSLQIQIDEDILDILHAKYKSKKYWRPKQWSRRTPKQGNLKKPIPLIKGSFKRKRLVDLG